MKAFLLVALSCLGGVATAGEVLRGDEALVEQYSYSQDLDIANVISISEVPNVCEVVPARMTYEDSKGHRHILEYRVMGRGCSSD